MAKSLGIWCADELNIDLHFNLWKLPSQKDHKNYEYFLDVGLNVRKDSIIESNTDLKLYLPFSIVEDQFLCLATCLIQDDNLLNSIFNKPLSYDDTKSNSSCFFIQDNQKRIDSFFINSLKDTKIKKNSNYSEIKIPIKYKKLAKNSQYYRFRIYLKGEKFTKLVQEKDIWSKASYKEEELIEFRVNEIRNLHGDIQSVFALNPNKIKIQNIHYFLVRNNEVDLILSHENFKRCRSVEHDIWQQYIEDTGCDLNNSKSILSYHWVAKAQNIDSPIEHYGTFAKFSHTKYDRFWIYLGFFIVASLGLGVLGEAVYDLNGKFGEMLTLIILFLTIGYVILKLCYNFFTWTKSLFCCLCEKIVCNTDTSTKTCKKELK